jgi:MoaA/NifB/PqqE/SkfB family radical SAM enzyme
MQANIRQNRYKKITKLLVAIIKFLLLKKPYVLMVETGTICNLNCPTCPTPREIIVGARTAKNMDFDDFKKIIDNSYKSFSAVVLFWSNEPLLNKEIARMVRYCDELNLYTFISTNVMLLTEEKIRELIKSGLDELLVCIDGFSAKTYERFRKGAKFETVKGNIESLCKIKKESNALNPWVEIQYIETKQNSEEVASCQEWAKEIGVDKFRLQPLYITRHLRDFKKLGDEFCIGKNWEERYKNKSRKGKNSCKNPNSTVCVLVNGQLAICCYDIKSTYRFGSLLENSFESIAKNKKYLKIKKQGEKRGLSICKGC